MNKKLVKIITNARKNAGLNQTEAGKIIGVKGNTISGWENGRTEPDIDSYIKLMHGYGEDPFSALRSAYNCIPAKGDEAFLDKYNQIGDEGRKMVDAVMEIEIQRGNEPRDSESA